MEADPTEEAPARLEEELEQDREELVVQALPAEAGSGYAGGGVNVSVAQNPRLQSRTDREFEAAIRADEEIAAAAIAAFQSMVKRMAAGQAEVPELKNHNFELDQHNAALKLALAAEKDKAGAKKEEYATKLEAILAAEKAKAEAMRTEHQSQIVEFEAELAASTAKLADRVSELQALKQEMDFARLCTICFEEPRNTISECNCEIFSYD